MKYVGVIWAIGEKSVNTTRFEKRMRAGVGCETRESGDWPVRTALETARDIFKHELEALDVKITTKWVEEGQPTEDKSSVELRCLRHRRAGINFALYIINMPEV